MKQAEILKAISEIPKKAPLAETLTLKFKLSSGVDLDTLTTTGIYTQGSNADAGSGKNYPAPLAGCLEVINDGTDMIYQRYTLYYSSSKVFIRGKYGSKWSAWVSLSLDGHNHDNKYFSKEGISNFIVKKSLGDKEDLNNITETGIYIQNSDAQANNGKNYPLPHSGVLEVVNYGMIYQSYRTYKCVGDRQFYRNYYSKAWGEWKEVSFTSHNHDKVYSKLDHNHDEKYLSNKGKIGTVNLFEGEEKEYSSSNEYVGIDITNIAKEYLGKDLTISFDLKCTKDATIQAYSLGKYVLYTGSYCTCKATTQYQRFSFRCKPSLNPQGAGENVCTLSFYGTYKTGNMPTVRNIKIEEGTIESSYNPPLSKFSRATHNHDNIYSKLNHNHDTKYFPKEGKENFIVKSDLGDKVDLDTITKTGIYTQDANRQASNGKNYPVPQAGVLEVIVGSSTIIYQSYRTYSDGGSKQYFRGWYSGKWGEWKEVSFTDHNHDTLYSKLNHDHDTKYSNINHNHDKNYSNINHNHDTKYAPKVHEHSLIKATDKRDVKPKDLVASNMSPFFVGLNGLHKDLPHEWGDLLAFNNYADNSGGKVNALGLSKMSNKMFHLQGSYGGDKWETQKELCYTDHNHDTTYSKLNHEHDKVYAKIDHNHNDKYAVLRHNHDSRYYEKQGDQNFEVKRHLDSTTDLNAIFETGIYIQGLDSGASTGKNFPIPYAGILEVIKDSNDLVYQKYRTYANQGDKIYCRSFLSHNGKWGAWKEISYSDHNHDSKYFPRVGKEDYTIRRDLGDKEDLNNVTGSGIYIQNSDSQANNGKNYPTPHAGVLEVVNNVMIYQSYRTYKNLGDTQYYRNFYSGAWGSWKEVSYSSHNHDERYKEKFVCVTPNTGANKANKWSKIALVTLNDQYADLTVKINVLDYAHGTPTSRTCSLLWRVKQQSPLGKPPMHTLKVSDIQDINPEEFSSVVVHNGNNHTTVELWVKNARPYSSIKCEVMYRAGACNPDFKMIMEHPYQDNLPLGSKIYGGFADSHYANFYAYGNGKTAHIGTGGKDVYLHNTKCESYLQLNDDRTLSFNDRKIFDESSVYGTFQILSVEGFETKGCNVETYTFNIGKFIILSFYFSRVNLNAGMTGQLSFQIPVGVKSWYGASTNIARVCFGEIDWRDNHWYKGQFGAGIAVTENNTRAVLNVQGTGVQGIKAVSVSGILILERK